MHGNDTPEAAGGRLSTDDIARSSERGAGPGTGRAEEARGAERAPTYPGEAIDTGGPDLGDRDREGDGESGAATGTETGTGTGTDTDTGTTGTTGSDTDTDMGATATPAEGSGSVDESPRLMDSGDEESFRTRWHELQSMFVDDPRQAVHEADTLVADVMQKLAATFADHRRSLEGQWRQGEDVDTESLRTALRRYRSFFHRLLSTGGDGESAESGTGEAAGRERASARPSE